MAKKIDDLNALEQSRAELAAQRPITDLDFPAAPKTAILGGLAWVHFCRGLEKPPSFEEFMSDRKASDLFEYLFDDEDDTDDDTETTFEAGDEDDGPFLADAGDRAAGRPGEAEGDVLPRDVDAAE